MHHWPDNKFEPLANYNKYESKIMITILIRLEQRNMPWLESIYHNMNAEIHERDCVINLQEHFEKSKVIFTEWKPKNNGPVLFADTILVLSVKQVPLPTDGQDGNESQLENFGPTLVKFSYSALL